MGLNLRQSGPFIGIGGLAVNGFLYFASASVVPWWVTLLLVGFWIVLFLLAFRWFSTKPFAMTALPFVAFAVWLAVVLGGGLAFGWG